MTSSFVIIFLAVLPIVFLVQFVRSRRSSPQHRNIKADLMEAAGLALAMSLGMQGGSILPHWPTWVSYALLFTVSYFPICFFADWLRKKSRVRVILKVGVSLMLLLMAAALADRLFGPLGSSSRSMPTECISNLWMLDGAKEEFALEHGKTNGESVSMADLVPYFRSGHLPYGDTCPFGGRYELGAIGLAPICSFGTNRVSWHYYGWLYLIYSYDGDSGNMHRIP